MSRIRIVERTGSTNADLLADVSAHEGDWLIALAQDAGRGRQGRVWQSQGGNFFGSTLIRLDPADPSPTTLSLAAGLALIEAVDTITPGAALMLKWPNDLLLRNEKLAGILLERSGDRIVAGFGVNLASAPALADRVAASLGSAIGAREFAPLLAATFGRRLGQWRAGEGEAIRTDWLSRAHPAGTPLSVHGAGAEPVFGTFAGVEPDGALRLETPGGLQLIRAGDVEL